MLRFFASRRCQFLPGDFGTDTVWWPRSRIVSLFTGERWLLEKRREKKKCKTDREQRALEERGKRKKTERVVDEAWNEKIRRLFVAGQSYVTPGCPFVWFIRHSVSSYRFHLAGTVLNRASEQQRRELSGWLSACFTTRYVSRAKRSSTCFM